MPYQSGFWGTAGLSLGRTKLHAPCPGGADCDLRDNAWRAHVGGKFNNIIGAEVGLLDLGDWSRGGGNTKVRGVDLALIAGVPIGQNASVFGKFGGAYMRTNVSGTGLTTGKESGWGPKLGIGAQIGLTQNWAVRLDADRYRIDVPGSTQNVDSFMVGAQYSFR
jgi:opacity protein-like surface antigen